MRALILIGLLLSYIATPQSHANETSKALNNEQLIQFIIKHKNESVSKGELVTTDEHNKALKKYRKNFDIYINSDDADTLESYKAVSYDADTQTLTVKFTRLNSEYILAFLGKETTEALSGHSYDSSPVLLLKKGNLNLTGKSIFSTPSGKKITVKEYVSYSYGIIPINISELETKVKISRDEVIPYLKGSRWRIKGFTYATWDTDTNSKFAKPVGDCTEPKPPRYVAACFAEDVVPAIVTDLSLVAADSTEIVGFDLKGSRRDIAEAYGVTF